MAAKAKAPNPYSTPTSNMLVTRSGLTTRLLSEEEKLEKRRERLLDDIADNRKKGTSLSDHQKEEMDYIATEQMRLEREKKAAKDREEEWLKSSVLQGL
jgi:hypothetical protein